MLSNEIPAFEATKRMVEEWAKERLIHQANPAKQMLKLTEEMGELAAAIVRDNKEDKIDAVGDILVVLTVLCQQLHLDLFQCYQAAYNQIKNRKGKNINGVFVKDEDLIRG